ncbi:MAG: efflux RND transporter periplasmic adaptor subunit [Pirellulales bacterium]
MKLSQIAIIILMPGVLVLAGCASEADSQERSADAANTAHSESEHGESRHGQAGHGAAEEGEAEHGGHKIVVTSPVKKDVIGTQRYVCQIHSCQHIEVKALQEGYLEEICVKEGQAVKKGALMFKILPVLYQARLDSEIAEAQRVQIELTNAETLLKKGIVSPQEIALKKAELAKAQAKVMLARAELSFASVTAPFDGIVDRQRNQLGSLIEEGDILTTFSDNSLMWVYFNVPEARYLEYKAELETAQQASTSAESLGDGQTANGNGNDDAEPLRIELKLANGEIFPEHGKIGAIEADFDNTTGNIPFRADFPNPNGLLRNGQTGTILIHTTMRDAIVIPQRATYPILAKRYAYVVDKDNIVRQRDIEIHSAPEDDIFVVSSGLDENDKIILEGIRQVRDGSHIEFEFQEPEKVLANLKYHAE